MSTPALKIYNTLTRTKEVFQPLDPANVRMYVCGPTVYDYAHIGNARPLIVFDVLYRLLRRLYGERHVKYVRNITDVDDKINARAAERGITIRELTEETNRVFQEDVTALGCLPPDVQPRATEHIAQMIAIIERLIAGGHAYAADGHVLFDVPSMKEYGRLSRRSLDEMLAGARVDVAPYKRGDMDFVLWKPSKETEPGWESPWGRGRPGWHIECSAMSWAHLGETFDIHGGGVDLVFPHHENEIAQSCCAFSQPVMANYWMHNGFLQVEGEKMSKSLGNFVTIHELLHTEKFGGRKWPGEVLRLAMLRTHYRQPIDWTVKALEEAELSLKKWAIETGVVEVDGDGFGMGYGSPDGDGYGGGFAGVRIVLEALEDDLNTPFALTAIHAIEDSQELKAALNLIGVNVRSYARWVEGERRSVNVEHVSSLIAARLAARLARNWGESDRIRDELAAMGIALKDNKDGTTTWEVKR
ncbi:cysteine--tRNA ligase [Methylocystis parvus]|uniref:Cysteine--tRNA ligase n=1 Tax=Methylocystis parvus TaxID=134 RepID=A0A6B8M8Y5_9HYPH|nr:cysteine--tRNA ligase [Methylocystis parvus]QGM99028.1 cysteine--tRNA ligase [Methylocystis parvus]WBK00607.1 cysteine--tRNA ligase [Methylocystis parvus OBBP]